MTPSPLLDLAKQGDPQAIAHLLNHSLRSRGLTATVTRQHHILTIQLTGDPSPDPASTLSMLHKGLVRLAVQGITQVEIAAFLKNQATPVWQRSFTLFPPALSPPPLQVGSLLHNRYRLEKLLAENAFRQTWLAKDRDQRPVVVKWLTFGGQMSWQDYDLFERETKVLQHLNHPHIPCYRDSFVIEGSPTVFGLVYDYVPGYSLKEWLTQGKHFTESEVRQIAESVLNILIYLHQLNPPLLHRDIKPSNLIVGEDQEIYLVDFGAVQDHSTREGRTFTVVGTYGYAPTEQFGGRAVPASDLYGLGATLIHLLTGTAPADLPQRELRIQFAGRVSIDASFARWLSRLVEPAPEHRYRTAQQALAVLQNPRLDSVDPQAKMNLAQAEVKALVGSLQTPHQVDRLLQTSHLRSNKIGKPYGTQVEVKHSPNQLSIHIPRRGIRLLDIPFLGIWGFWIITILVGSIIHLLTNLTAPIGLPLFFLLLAIGILTWLLQFYLGTTEVKFTQQDFQIERRFAGILLRRGGIIAPILDVFQETRYNRHWSGVLLPKDDQVTIQMGIHTYSFGHQALTKVECLWIAHEIKQWIGLA
ncbi:MAG: serine/threonine-protein kinase [Cyanobacteriota bacterium]|nr:serine/threonine-protein kinase [Cyanobacteriota bacterium]